MKLIGLVGPGNLGRTVALSLPAEIWTLGPVLSHSRVSSRRAVREMKRGYAVDGWADFRDASAVLIAAPHHALPNLLAAATDHLPEIHTKRLLITSLADAEARAAIARLRSAGAHVGGMLPIAVYRRPSLVAPNTTFAIWGSPPARRAARDLVKAISANYATIDDNFDRNVLLGIGMAAGLITAGFELAVRRLVEAGFTRHQAIEAVSSIGDLCLQEHRSARQGPPSPWLPADCAELLQSVAQADPAEAALCHAAVRFACEDLR